MTIKCLSVFETLIVFMTFWNFEIFGIITNGKLYIIKFKINSSHIDNFNLYKKKKVIVVHLIYKIVEKY